MELGYSLLLGEFVQAAEIDLGDCETYQIACPACRSPVFKKARGRADGETTHFLSHYRAGSGDEKDCELRTSVIGAGVTEARNAEARGQHLRVFLSVLPKAIRNAEAPNHPPGRFDAAVATLLAKPMFRNDFVPIASRYLRTLLDAPALEPMIDASIASFPRFEGMSPFWRRRQAAYVADALRHIVTPSWASNMIYLSAAAFANIGLRADAYRQRRGEPSVSVQHYNWRAAISVVEALVRGKPPATVRAIAARESGTASARTKEEALARLRAVEVAIGTESIGPMVGILASVPFADLVRDRNATLDLSSRTAGLERLFEELLGSMARSEAQAPPSSP